MLPVSSYAQQPFSIAKQQSDRTQAEIGGKSSLDIVRLDPTSLSQPLRNGGVLPNSEVVELEGRTLKRGVDYSMDYASGAVMLARMPKSGSTMRVSYRYDASRPQPAGGSLVGGVNGYTFNLMSGATMMLGLGMTERLADGTVLSSNLYGMRNSFGLKGGGLTGLTVLSERKRVQADSPFGSEGKKAETETGKSRAILQNLNASALGGKFEASYQDVQKNFSGFQAFRGAGYENAFVDQLQKEKGLKRISLGFTGIGSRAFNLRNGFQTIEDSKGKITWRSLGFDAGPLKMDWSATKVDKEFQRFGDIREADREQLAKEQGMTRQSLVGSLSLKGGTAGFTSSTVTDDKEKSLVRRRFSFNSKRFTLGYSDQTIDKQFGRFQSLREPDAGQLAREAGLSRRTYTLDVLPGNRFLTAMNLTAGSLRSEEGSYDAAGMLVSGDGWRFERFQRGTSGKFASAGAMTDAEMLDNERIIGRMYDTTDAPIKPEDKGAFLSTVGVERQATRLSIQPSKGVDASLEELKLQGEKGGGTVKTVRIGGGKFSFFMREQDLSRQFVEVGQLLEFERNKLGVTPGLRKSDLAISAQLGKNRSVSFAQMGANVEDAGASRQSFSYKDKGFDLVLNRRRVDANFSSVGLLPDSERGLLASLVGSNQSETLLKWQAYRGLNVELQWFDNRNAATDQTRLFRNTAISFAPDRFTSLVWHREQVRDDDPANLIDARTTETLSLSRNFGKLGGLSYAEERKQFDGASELQPDSTKRAISYEAKVSENTTLKTERIETNYENGESETVQANTVSTELNKRTGISVTDVAIDRSGDKPDENKRNYGFWWDFGRGLRLNYGYARQLTEGANGTLNMAVSLTPGEFQGIKVDSATYALNRWDKTRNQSLGNAQIGTVRPVDFGILRQFSFQLGADTARDNNVWGRQNQGLNLAAKLFGNTVGYRYFSQIDPSGKRAVDRVFSFATNQSDKSKLKASVTYKLRTLPQDQQVMIRNYSFAAKPIKGLEISHQLLTNPEVARGDVLLGSIPQPTRVNKWALGFDAAGAKAQVSWEEILNEQTKTLNRVASVNLTLFPNNPSPLYLSYGLEQGDLNGQRRTQHRYSLRFDQRPGANQLLSIYAGNISWQNMRPTDQKLQNWTVRAEYQLKF